MTLSIAFYSLWSIFGVSNIFVEYSVVFVEILLLRYTLSVEMGGFGDPIEVILGDKSILLIGLLYVLYILVSLYVLA